jgi:hypothetical protein
MQWFSRLIFCVMVMSNLALAAEADLSTNDVKVQELINKFKESGFAPKDNIITRDDWGAAEQNVSGISKQSSITRLILGHTVTDGDDAIEVVASIQRDQMNENGWADIGYHFCVSCSANVLKGRKPDQVPAIYLGNNLNSCAIGFIGNFHTEEVDGNKPKEVTDEMVYRYGKVLAYIVQNFKDKKCLANIVNWNKLTRYNNVYCMCDLRDPKTNKNRFPYSPGKNFTDRLDEILGVANYYLEKVVE